MRIDFADKGLKDFYEVGSMRAISPSYASRLRKCLSDLSASMSIHDLSGVHPLRRGEYKGAFALKVSGAWRLVFRFSGGEATECRFLQYH